MDVAEAKKDFKISSPIGTKLPITAGAIGKIFLSAMNNEEVVEFLKDKGLPEYTENSITDIDLFMKEIEKTRDLGYSLDVGEYLKGIRAAASLIYQDSSPVAAIWFVGFSNSMVNEKLEYIIKNLKNTAQEISSRLSFSPF